MQNKKSPAQNKCRINGPLLRRPCETVGTITSTPGFSVSDGFVIKIRRKTTVLGPLPKTGRQVEAQEALLDRQVEILQLCNRRSATGKELLATVGYSSRTGNFKRGLGRLFDMKLLEMTIPNKPNSPLQKYRLTEKGRATLKAREQGEKKT